MLDFYPQFWTKAFDFEGLTKRNIFWKVFLVNAVLGLLIPRFSEPLYYLFAIATICPGIAITVRRIRDTGRQWQWIFILLVPIIGPFWLLWIECQPSSASNESCKQH